MRDVQWNAAHNRLELSGCLKEIKTFRGKAMARANVDSLETQCRYCACGTSVRCYGFVCAERQRFAWMNISWAVREKSRGMGFRTQ
jgi:hypothetical protein